MTGKALDEFRGRLEAIPAKGGSAFIGSALPIPQMTELWNLRQVAREDVRRLLNAIEAVLAYGVDRENYTNTGNAEADAAIRSYAYHVRRVVTTALEAKP